MIFHMSSVFGPGRRWLPQKQIGVESIVELFINAFRWYLDGSTR